MTRTSESIRRAALAFLDRLDHRPAWGEPLLLNETQREAAQLVYAAYLAYQHAWGRTVDPLHWVRPLEQLARPRPFDEGDAPWDVLLRRAWQLVRPGEAALAAVQEVPRPVGPDGRPGLRRTTTVYCLLAPVVLVGSLLVGAANGDTIDWSIFWCGLVAGASACLAALACGRGLVFIEGRRP